MKDFGTVFLAFIGILASMLFLLCGLCSFIGGISSSDGLLLLLGITLLAIGVVVVILLVKFNKPTGEQ